MYIGLHVEYPLFLSDLMQLEFPRQITEISNFMKLCPVGAELFRADWQTILTKLIVAFRKFANAPTHIYDNI
jgi:hypothetical protein